MLDNRSFALIFLPQWFVRKDNSIQDFDRALEIIHKYVTFRDLATFV